MPLGQDEEVWQVEGPPNLDARLADAKEVKQVFPSSDMTLY